jgi:hypothetical protein
MTPRERNDMKYIIAVAVIGVLVILFILWVGT